MKNARFAKRYMKLEFCCPKCGDNGVLVERTSHVTVETIVPYVQVFPDTDPDPKTEADFELGLSDDRVEMDFPEYSESIYRCSKCDFILKGVTGPRSLALSKYMREVGFVE